MDIDFFTEQSGKSPILKFLKKISPASHVKIINDDISLLETSDIGLLLKSKTISKVRNIWELRSECENNIIYRTLFGIIKNVCYILNIYNKKEKKLKNHEIDLAIKRFKQIQKLNK